MCLPTFNLYNSLGRPILCTVPDAGAFIVTCTHRDDCKFVTWTVAGQSKAKYIMTYSIKVTDQKNLALEIECNCLLLMYPKFFNFHLLGRAIIYHNLKNATSIGLHICRPIYIYSLGLIV